MPLAEKENEKEKVSNIEALEKELQFSKKLNFITNKINSTRDIDDILINLRESILGLFDADRLTIYVVEGAKKEIFSRFKTGEEISEIRSTLCCATLRAY